MPLHELPEPYDEAITGTVDVRLAGRADDDPGDEAPSAEAEPPLESTEIATGTARSAAGIDVLAQAGGQGEPIRTRTMARLLASHGYHDRALAIYEHLLAEQPDDEALRAEAATAREALAQKAG
jgi:hypothetical protein